MAKKINSRYIPVEVMDLKIGTSTEYNSISEAARSLNIYPKAIWRKVKSKELYKDRYLIKSKFKINNIKYKKTYNKNNNSTISFSNNKYRIYSYIFFILIFLILSTWEYMLYIGLVLIDAYNIVFHKFTQMDINTLNQMLDDELRSSKTKTYMVSDKINGLADFNNKWRCDDLLKNGKDYSILKINKPIINTISLDIPDTEIATRDISLDVSPIVNQLTLDNMFSKAIASTKPTINIINSNFNDSPIMGTHSLYGNNRNYTIINSILFGPKSPGREILNYESNVLYCLINGLTSPALPKV